MKRGVEVLPLFINQHPFVGKSYIDRAIESYTQIASYVPHSNNKLFSAPMKEIMVRITESAKPKYICILCKRSMYRIAEEFAKKNKAKAIITGESLGQVASQTLSNLYVLSSSIKLSILRPLIGLDKVEIEDIARKIGTYKITAKSIEGCKAVPMAPATRSKIKNINENGTTVLLVEQNARMALEYSNRGYVFKIGEIALIDTGENLLVNDEVRKSFLGES